MTNGRRAGERRGSPDAPAPHRRSQAARHPVVLLANMVMFAVVVTLVAGVALLVIGQQMFTARGPLTEDVGVVIERGAPVQSIAQGLREQGIITNEYVFLAAAYGTDVVGRMQAGEYRIPAAASMAEVLDRLVSGRVIQHAITFAEGLTSAQIVARLMADDVLTGPVEEIPPEGSLLPETYNYSRGEARSAVLARMRAARDAAVERVWRERDPDLPIETPEDLVTLASIVEKETGQADERERVAAVFVNRLEEGMRLQSDPTILYGLYGGEAWSEPRTIYRSDIDRQTPYNTYQIDGLPPGPIANPGLAALEATARPAETDELFFVADGSGGHAFAETYEAHQQNVARWREVEAGRASATSGTR
ncbi:endolytic transglycosylase MltG [Acuticoccus sp.]|uniref:endolytic transglycosylase MltG n=1 Tax=Acuticoccus sp. TaxID=1904378 RepID=UPI003B51AC1F